MRWELVVLSIAFLNSGYIQFHKAGKMDRDSVENLDIVENRNLATNVKVTTETEVGDKKKLKINRFLTRAVSLRKRANDDRIKSEKSSQSNFSNKVDFPCSPCVREKKLIESTSFCKDCNEKLCPQCVQFHKKFQVLRTHAIVNIVEHLAIKEAKKAEKKKIHKVDVRCKHHHGKLIEMYCPEHDEVGCKACMAINHKGCGKPEFVVDKCEGISHGNELMNVKKDLHSMKIQVADLKLQRKGDLKRLTAERDTILHTLAEFRKTVNEILDKLEKEVKEKLNKKFDEDSTMIKNDINKCEEQVAKTESLLEKLRTGPESHVFVHMKADARTNLRGGEKVATSVMGHLGREGVYYTIDEEVKSWFKELTSLGRFDHELGSFTGVLVGNFELTLETDVVKTDCIYNGSAAIPDNRSYKGRTVVADWKNKRLKLLDKSYRVMAHCDLTGVPYGVCGIDSGQLIVSLRDDKVIQFVSVDHRLKPGRKFKIDEFCRGIAYHDEEIYVACGGGVGEAKGQLRVYNMTGELVKVIDEDIHGKPIFSSPKDIAINNEGTRIYVSDRDKGVIALGKSGKVKYVFNDSVLKTAFGICTNEKDELFVTGYDSNNVIHVGPNGKMLGEVLTAAEGLVKPISMCCHENPISRLLITTELKSTLGVYELLDN